LGCGIFGIFKHSGNAAVEIYEGLLMLQHRGQDSAGIVSFDGERFRERKARAVRELACRWHTALFAALVL
jgi:amidophosphoribosyltransferase